MELLVKPQKYSYKEYLEAGCDGFLLPLEGYCSDYLVCFSLLEVEAWKQSGKPVYVVMNKMFYDDELEGVKTMLQALEQMGVAGVFFYDLAVLNFKLELGLSLALVWNQTHLVTNSKTCQYYFERGVKYGVLSSEITEEEMKKIITSTEMQFFLFWMGHQVVALSKRKLLTNYYQQMKEEISSSLTITEPVSGEQYDVHEDKTGTSFFFHRILNSTKAFPHFRMTNVKGILNEDNIPHDLFLKLLSLQARYLETNDENYLDEVTRLIGTYDGFRTKKTIFKVKG